MPKKPGFMYDGAGWMREASSVKPPSVGGKGKKLFGKKGRKSETKKMKMKGM